MQARSPAVANEPTERESAGLVIAALLHEVEALRIKSEADIAVLCARVCRLGDDFFKLKIDPWIAFDLKLTVRTCYLIARREARTIPGMANDYDPLDYWRNELATAEGRLRNARDSLEKAAKGLGRSSGLFSETFFVPRTTAERWVETAEQKFFEREKENFEYVKEALGALAAATKSKSKAEKPG